MTSDPHRSPSLEELGVLVQQLSTSVAALHQRIAMLEQRGAPPVAGWAQPPAMSGRTQPLAPAAAAPPPPPAAMHGSPATLPSPGPWPPPIARSPPVSGQPPGPWWQVGPLQSITPDKAPIVALAAAGGLAVLVGMLFFVWYAVERGWLSPTTRLLLGGAAGLGMLVASWPLADRHRAAAGGLGGAGLGTWFGVWIVARHVHGVVGPTETFAGLAAVSATCLVISGLRQLRLMAILGAIAAFATPIATATGADRLHELMIYQLLVMGALVALEQYRRWPELGHMAVGGTWLLMAGWASEHLDTSTADKLLTWAGVLLLVTSAQTVLLRVRDLPPVHAAGRHLMGGLFAWSVITAAAWDRIELLAWLTLGMALWHLAVLGWSRVRGPCLGLDAVLLGLGWAQLFAFGPIRFEGSALPGWWLSQGTVGALTVAVGRGWLPMRLAAAPLLGVVGWTLDAQRSDTGLAFGLAVAAVLTVIALWPGGRSPAVEPSEHEPGGIMAVLLLTLAALTAGGLAELHLDPSRTELAAFAVAGVGLAGTVRAFAWLDPLRVKGTMIALALGLAWAVGHAVFDHLLDHADAGAARAAVAVAAFVLGAMGLALLLLLRRSSLPFAAIAEQHDAAGLVAVLGPALALQMLVGSWLFSAMPGDPGLWSLILASMSVIAALASLLGLVAGLRLQRETWRKLALGGLVAVAAKVVLVDLSEVDIAYRVLSFVGLGACMLLGAIAYGRALKHASDTPAGDE
jgi:uncharacterized membrane protein